MSGSSTVFVSYAQNFEDVILWRALSEIDSGFYIDVGAADPDAGSVTRAFYERGWRGINIEPEPGYAAALRAKRERDINLHVAVGRQSGNAILYRIPDTGLSSLVEEIAASHERLGFPLPTPYKVKVRTLAEICERYAPNTIHFLKIDAEGFEEDILQGADFSKFRPWIVLAEATLPFSSKRVSSELDEIMSKADYRLKYFDGLNTWYVSAERESSLRDVFLLPPNVFDRFVLASVLEQTGRANQYAEKAISETEARKKYAAQLDSEHRRLVELEAAWHEKHGRVVELEAAWHQKSALIDQLTAENARLNRLLDASQTRIRQLEELYNNKNGDQLTDGL